MSSIEHTVPQENFYISTPLGVSVNVQRWRANILTRAYHTHSTRRMSETCKVRYSTSRADHRKAGTAILGASHTCIPAHATCSGCGNQIPVGTVKYVRVRALTTVGLNHRQISDTAAPPSLELNACIRLVDCHLRWRCSWSCTTMIISLAPCSRRKPVERSRGGNDWSSHLI